MQTIKLRSMGSDVVLLQQLLNKWGYKVDETGLFDEQTDIMVRDFQRKNKLAVDGIVGKGTWSKLQDENARQTATLRLTEEDFKRCAEILGVEVAAVKAVQEVETGGRGGFFAPGRPAILFEGHIFWSQLKKYGLNPEEYVKGNEDILYPKWTKSHYKGGMGEYDRLKKALAIHFTAFLKSNGWDNYLRTLNWTEFARHYNGPQYAQNKYDEKLQKAYMKYKQ